MPKLSIRTKLTSEYLEQYDEALKVWKSNSYYKPTLDNYFKIFVEYGVVDNLIDRCLRLKEFGLRSACKERYILLYGDIVGLQKWTEYVEFQSRKNTREYKKKVKGWTDEEFDQYNRSRSNTKENFIRRYGEQQGKKKWKVYINTQRDAGCTLKYFVEKYGEEKGTLEYERVNLQKALTLQNFVRKYGEVDGHVRFEQYVSSKRWPYSKVSQKFFWEIFDHLLPEEKEHCYFAEYNKEFNKVHSDGVYLYDFVISSLKYCVEFNGILYHADPMIYEANDVPPFQMNTKTAREIWDFDKTKQEYLRSKGFVVDIVWENRYNLEDVLSSIRRLRVERNNRLGS